MPYQSISLWRHKGIRDTFQIFFPLQLLFLLLFFINVVLTLISGWKLKLTWFWQGSIVKALTLFVARILQQKGTKQNLQTKYCIKVYVKYYVKNIAFKNNLCRIFLLHSVYCIKRIQHQIWRKGIITNLYKVLELSWNLNNVTTEWSLYTYCVYLKWNNF